MDEDDKSWRYHGSQFGQKHKVVVGSGLRKVVWSYLLKDLISQVKKCFSYCTYNKDLIEFFIQNSDKIKFISETQIRGKERGKIRKERD